MSEILIHRDSARALPHLIAELQAAGAEIVLYDDYDAVTDPELRKQLDARHATDSSDPVDTATGAGAR
jgi:hypothetical protein